MITQYLNVVKVINKLYDKRSCGAGGDMRASHAADQRSIPVEISFLGEVFGGFLRL